MKDKSAIDINKKANEILKEEFDMPIELDNNEPKSRKSESQSIYSNDSVTFDNLEIISLNTLFSTKFPEPRWLIDKTIPYNGISAISGVPKTGKSLLSLYLAYCVSNGSRFLGEFKTQQGGVLIINKEDPQRLIQERFKLLSKNRNLPIHLCSHNDFYLDTDKYVDFLIAFVKHNEIKLIIFDSFRRIFKGEENSSQVISEVHNRFKKLIEIKDLSLLFIHHHGKEGMIKRKNKAEKLRGSSDILAMLDCLLVLETKDIETLIITQAALRQDKPIQPFLIKRKTNGGFELLNYIEPEKEIKEEIKVLVLDLLKDGAKTTTEILALTLEAGYKKTITKYSLDELRTFKKIGRDKSSRPYKYFLIGVDSKSSPEQGILEPR